MRTFSLLAISLVAGCSSCGGASEEAPSPAPIAPVAGVTYDVHEWGLVRGTANDHVMISGPRAEPVPMVVAKPVLYFHRRGEGALVVDVEARIVGGHVVEHWPSPGGRAGERASWHGVLIEDRQCSGSRYPSLAEDPCSLVTDGCEAATLRGSETSDASCLSWPRPPGGDGPTQLWNHLFYRGEIAQPPPFPLALEVRPDGTLRVTARDGARVPGRLIRVRLSNGTPNVSDGVAIVAPPAPGQSIVIPAPSAATTTGVNALTESLREVGLTDPEIEAFHRAWETAMFGSAPTAAAAAETIRVTRGGLTTAMPMIPPAPSSSLVYLLPPESVEALATLSFSPPPAAVRRAIVAWIGEMP